MNEIERVILKREKNVVVIKNSIPPIGMTALEFIPKSIFKRLKFEERLKEKIGSEIIFNGKADDLIQIIRSGKLNK